MDDGSKARGFGPRVSRSHLLPETALDRVSQRVVEANSALMAALERMDGYKAKLREAQSALDAAPRQDAAARKNSIEAGKSPPASTVPKREQALSEARVNLATAKEVASDRKRDLERVVVADRERWAQVALEDLQKAIAASGRTRDDVRRIEQLALEVQFARGFDPGNQGFDTTTFPRALALDGPLPSELIAKAEATIASLADRVTSGPSAADQQAKREAELEERRRRRERRRAAIRTTQGITAA